MGRDYIRDGREDEDIRRLLRLRRLHIWKLSDAEWRRLEESGRLAPTPFEGQVVYVDESAGLVFVRE